MASSYPLPFTGPQIETILREANAHVNSANNTDTDIPLYIKEAADEVINKVNKVSYDENGKINLDIEKTSHRTFNLIAISDFHYYDYNVEGYYNDDDCRNKISLINASKAIAYIKSHMHIDAIATLGDNMQVGSGTEEQLARAHKWSREINEILEKTQGPGIIDFRTPGNHDRLGSTENDGKTDGSADIVFPDSAVHNYITGYNRQLTYYNIPIGYGYHDFANYKLRVILLNTAELDGKARFDVNGGFWISTAQYKWFIETLDLSAKEDASEWQILLLSHHGPDDPQEVYNGGTNTNGYILPNILNAYIKGSSFTCTRPGSGDSISCDFNGKNAAKLVAAIHGHDHNYLYNLVRTGSAYDENYVRVLRVGTPTAQFLKTHGNYFVEIEVIDGVKKQNLVEYTSTTGTVTETAFCLYSIDLDDKIIYAIHYGNGDDRVLDYDALDVVLP